MSDLTATCRLCRLCRPHSGPNILYGKHGQSTVRSFAAVCEWYVAIQQHFFTFLRFTHEEVARHIENRTLPLSGVLAFIDIRY